VRRPSGGRWEKSPPGVECPGGGNIRVFFSKAPRKHGKEPWWGKKKERVEANRLTEGGAGFHFTSGHKKKRGPQSREAAKIVK